MDISDLMKSLHTELASEARILKCTDCAESRQPQLHNTGGMTFLEQPGSVHRGCGGTWGKTDDPSDRAFAKLLSEHGQKEQMEDVTNVIANFHTKMLDSGIDSHFSGLITAMFASGGIDKDAINRFR